MTLLWHFHRVGRHYQLLALNQGSSFKFMTHSFGVARQKSGMENPGLRLNKCQASTYTYTYKHVLGQLLSCAWSKVSRVQQLLLNTVTFLLLILCRTQWSLQIWTIVSTCVRGLRPSWPKHQLTSGIHDMCSSVGLKQFRQFSWKG